MRTVALPLTLLLVTACSGDAVETWQPPIDEASAPLAAERAIEAGTSRGVLGGYEHGRIWGWAEIVGDRQPVEVRIDVDGEPIATVLADTPRADLVDKHLHPTGHAGFELVVDELPEGAAVDATIVATGQRLTNGPCVVQGTEGVSSCTEGQPRGILAGYRHGTVWGWAHVQGRADPVEVRIEVDGEPVATVVADRFREDLYTKRLHPTGEAGFRAEVGELAGESSVAAFIVGEGFRLTRAPAVLREP